MNPTEHKKEHVDRSVLTELAEKPRWIVVEAQCSKNSGQFWDKGNSEARRCTTVWVYLVTVDGAQADNKISLEESGSVE